jgi:hypothetical protein
VASKARCTRGKDTKNSDRCFSWGKDSHDGACSLQYKSETTNTHTHSTRTQPSSLGTSMTGNTYMVYCQVLSKPTHAFHHHCASLLFGPMGKLHRKKLQLLLVLPRLHSVHTTDDSTILGQKRLLLSPFFPINQYCAVSPQ